MPARPLAEDRAHLAEPAHEEVVGQRRQVADRPDAVLLQRRRPIRADAPQPRDRERREERRLGARRDDDQAVGLAEVAGDLGDQLRRRDPDRDRQPDLAADRVLDLPADRSPSPKSRCEPVTSRNASSIEIGSTSGVNRRRIAMTCG